MMTYEQIITLLLDLYNKDGYLSEDQVYSLCNNNELSNLETNIVFNKLLEKDVYIGDEYSGIISYRISTPINNTSKPLIINKQPLKKSSSNKHKYDIMFEYVMDNYPQMNPIIQTIKTTTSLSDSQINDLLKSTKYQSEKSVKKRIIESNLIIALYAAFRHKNNTDESFEDIFSIACIGLIEAVDSFKTNSKPHFTRYANSVINRKIKDYIVSNNYGILPFERYTELCKVNNIYKSIITYQQNLLIRELSASLHSSEAKALLWLNWAVSNDIIYIDELQEDDPILVEKTDWIEECLTKVYNGALHNAINRLSENEKQVIMLRYGFKNGICYTQKEIGQKLSCSSSNISQIEAKVLKRLYYQLKQIYNKRSKPHVKTIRTLRREP